LFCWNETCLAQNIYLCSFQFAAPSGFFLNVEPTLELGTVGDVALSSIITLADISESVGNGELARDFAAAFNGEDESIDPEEEICDVEESWGDQVSGLALLFGDFLLSIRPYTLMRVNCLCV